MGTGKLWPRSGMLSELIDTAICLAAIAVIALTAATCCCGAERLDVSILDRLDTTATAAPDALDCSILAALDAPATAPAQLLDVSILSALDGNKAATTKPRVKPSKAALEALRKAVDIGDEVGSMYKPLAASDYVYPQRHASHQWTHPGNIRSHVMQGQHAGKLTAEQVAKMSNAKLEEWHSLDHEGKATPPVKTIAVAPASWGGHSEFIWLDGSRHPTPQPGANYPTLGGVLVPAVQSTQQAPQPVRVQSGCPGSVCPVQVKPTKGLKKLLG